MLPTAISSSSTSDRRTSQKRSFPGRRGGAWRRSTATVEELWQQDLAAYTEAYLAAARRYLTDRGVTCGVELTTSPTGERATWDTLTDQVHEFARANAPLPMSGQAPDWTQGRPADALRRAGLTYVDRACHF